MIMLIGLAFLSLYAGFWAYWLLVFWQIRRCSEANRWAIDVAFAKDWRNRRLVYGRATANEGAMWLQPWRNPFKYYQSAMSDFLEATDAETKAA